MDIVALRNIFDLVIMLIDGIISVFVGFSFVALIPTDIYMLILLGLEFAAWIALFVLQGIGIYRMAANRGLKKKWLAFIPFANIWYLGKLSGECSFYGQKVKRAGLYTMLAQIVSSVLSVLIVTGSTYLSIKYGVEVVSMSGVSGDLDNFVFTFCEIGGLVLMILSVVHCFLTYILMMGVYKHYAPASHKGLAFLTILFSPARSIILFVLRNRKAIDYEAYVKARREEYIRRQQQYYNQYGNPYGRPNPYGQSPYGHSNPYGQNPYGQPTDTQPQPPEEPFGEFSNSGKTTSEASAEAPTSETESGEDFFN